MLEPLFDYFQASPLALCGLITILLLCGLGLPLPEDVVLITAGVLAGSKGHTWISASVAMYFGVIGGDIIAFRIGRRYGVRVLGTPWAVRFFTAEKRRLVEKLFARFGAWVFFAARFMPGMRAGIFCMAGAMRASFSKFLFFDGVAALVSVPLWVWFGHLLWTKFGDNLSRMSGEIDSARALSLWLMLPLVAMIAFALWRLARRLR